jgi:signal transduction histidine kinase
MLTEPAVDAVVEAALDARSGVAGRIGLASDHLLERVALALNSTLELRDVLRVLAEITLEVTGAARCGLFLLEGGTVEPVIAIGTVPDEDLWEEFRTMGSVPLDVIPTAWEHLLQGRAVPVPDARSSVLIPISWIDRFDLKAVALVPLLAMGEPCGVMGIDYQSWHEFSDDETRLLEAIGMYAGVAIRNARLFDSTRRRARLKEALAAGAAALVSQLEFDGIALKLADAYSDLLGARLCAIGLIGEDQTHVTTLATHGVRQSKGSIPMSDIPERLRSKLIEPPESLSRSIQFGGDPWLSSLLDDGAAGISRFLVLPLIIADRVRGGVLLGFDEEMELDAEQRGAAEALASMAAAALERSMLLEKLGRQLRRVEVLHGLGSALAEQANATTLVRRLNELLADDGIEIVGLAFRDKSLDRRLGGLKPTPEERALWRTGKSFTTLADGTLAIRMKLGRRAIGSVRVRASDLPVDDRSFIAALANGVAEVANRGALRTEVEEAGRERAVAAERDRIAADLHDTAGQLFVAIKLLAQQQGETIPQDSPWAERFKRFAELADRGKWEIDQVIRALRFFPAARTGLVPSIKSLARNYEMDSGINVLVSVEGAPAQLTPQVERALYRIAHEGLANAWRHACCEHVAIHLEYGSNEVALSVTDDGVGLTQTLKEEGPRVGIANMRKSVEQVGGSFRIRAAKPRGLRIEARVKEGSASGS